MCARLLTKRPHSSRSPGRWGQIESGINRLIAFYARLLDIVLTHRRLTALTAHLTLVLTLWLAVIIPKGFFPTQDTGLIQGITQMPETISFEGMKNRQSQVIAALMNVPDVEKYSGFIGVDGENMTLNTGRLMISLKPWKARTASLETTLARLSEAGNHVVGARLYLQSVQDLSLDSALSATQYKFVLENADRDAFKFWVPRLIKALQQQPALKGVTSDLQSNGLMAFLTLDRATAARYAITPQTVDNLLYDSFGQRQVSTVYTQSNQYRLILEAEPRFQGSLEQLKQLYLPAHQIKWAKARQARRGGPLPASFRSARSRRRKCASRLSSSRIMAISPPRPSHLILLTVIPLAMRHPRSPGLKRKFIFLQILKPAFRHGGGVSGCAQS